METVLFVVLVLIVLGGLFLRRGNKESAPKKKTERRSNTTSSADDTAFHAVSIKFPPRACDAAREMDGKRFLSSDAPHIPLPDCDIVDCQCRFVHFRDRRGRVDRRSVFSSSGISATTGKFEQERRHGDERRDEDEEEDYF